MEKYKSIQIYSEDHKYLELITTKGRKFADTIHDLLEKVKFGEINY